MLISTILFSVAMFTVAGEHLTLRMRKLAFASMLKQEMAWFDNPKNNTGALCSRLSADAAAIQGVSLFYSTLLIRIQFIYPYFLDVDLI